MNKHLPAYLFSLTVFAILLLLSANSAKASESIENPYLTDFLTLHSQYCEKKYNDHETLTKILEVAPDLSASSKFINVYEMNKNGINYAVSLEQNGCTTDVMIQTASEEELFSFEDINKAMINLGYIETGEVTYGKDIGTDHTKVIVVVKKFISPEGEMTVLDFPLEKKDKYYMTLHAEKFNPSKKTPQAASVKRMAMMFKQKD